MGFWLPNGCRFSGARIAGAATESFARRHAHSTMVAVRYFTVPDAWRPGQRGPQSGSPRSAADPRAFAGRCSSPRAIVTVRSVTPALCTVVRSGSWHCTTSDRRLDSRAARLGGSRRVPVAAHRQAAGQRTGRAPAAGASRGAAHQSGHRLAASVAFLGPDFAPLH
jgi:hypothetical protein